MSIEAATRPWEEKSCRKPEPLRARDATRRGASRPRRRLASSCEKKCATFAAGSTALVRRNRRSPSDCRKLGGQASSFPPARTALLERARKQSGTSRRARSAIEGRRALAPGPCRARFVVKAIAPRAVARSAARRTRALAAEARRPARRRRVKPRVRRARAAGPQPHGRPHVPARGIAVESRFSRLRTAKRVLELCLRSLEHASLRRPQLRPRTIHVERQHRHRRSVRIAFSPMAALGGPLERSRDALGVFPREHAAIEVERVALLRDAS